MTYLADNIKARCLHADGSYERRQLSPGETVENSQAVLLHRALHDSRG